MYRLNPERFARAFDAYVIRQNRRRGSTLVHERHMCELSSALASPRLPLGGDHLQAAAAGEGLLDERDVITLAALLWVKPRDLVHVRPGLVEL